MHLIAETEAAGLRRFDRDAYRERRIDDLIAGIRKPALHIGDFGSIKHIGADADAGDAQVFRVMEFQVETRRVSAATRLEQTDRGLGLASVDDGDHDAVARVRERPAQQPSDDDGVPQTTHAALHCYREIRGLPAVAQR